MEVAFEDLDLHVPPAGWTLLTAPLNTATTTGLMQPLNLLGRTLLTRTFTPLPQFEPPLDATAHFEGESFFLAPMASAPARICAFAICQMFQHRFFLELVDYLQRGD